MDSLTAGTCYFSSSALKKEDTGQTETLITVLQTALCHVTEDLKFILVVSARSPKGDIDQTIIYFVLIVHFTIPFVTEDSVLLKCYGM